MRILVVGAGAIGGYFGGRLVQAGQDVTFLVRAPRAAQLAQAGLRIESALGDATLHEVRTVQAEALQAGYDLILLSCKAYDLADAITSLAPAVGPDTLILPLLNGMRHLDTLGDTFGAARVLGGQCVIAATLTPERVIKHLGATPAMTFGARDDSVAPERIEAIAAALRSGGFGVTVSAAIEQDMWEKWLFLATLAGSTSLFRATVGDILTAPGGEAAIAGLLAECQAVARAHGHAPRAAFDAGIRTTLFAPGSPLTASMMRDLESNARIEADQIIGDMIRRAGTAGLASEQTRLLQLVYTHLKAYEARRERVLAAGG
jgi:2-dehydropantoate 2-reductase